LRLCFSSIVVDAAPADTLNAKGTAAIQTGQNGSLMSSSLSFICYTLIFLSKYKYILFLYFNVSRRDFAIEITIIRFEKLTGCQVEFIQ
jgi:hypothetical protein